MSAGEAGEATLADVQRGYPGWQWVQGAGGFCYAEHVATGTGVNGEDPLDLRDQIKAVAARLACGQHRPGPAIITHQKPIPDDHHAHSTTRRAPQPLGQVRFAGALGGPSPRPPAGSRGDLQMA